MLKVGLTGNIGSGKTTVAKIFHILGIPVFNADKEAKNLYRTTEVKERLIEITGPGILDPGREVNRKKLAAFLFRDQDLLEKVNQLVHPLVRDLFHNFSEGYSSKPYILYEAAILVESGYYKELDKLIVVSAPEEMRLGRVMKRDGVPQEEVRARAKLQMPDKDKIEVAYWMIHNDGAQLIIPQVLEIDNQLRSTI